MPLHCIHSNIVFSKIRQGFENYEKNTGKTHPSATREVEKRGAGTPLTDDNSQLWYGSISVGTPSESFTGGFSLHTPMVIYLTSFAVDFDTGSR